MRETIFVKYSNERDDRFKIKTVISQDNNGNRYVEKHALTKAAQKHIEQIAEYGNQLNHYAEGTRFYFSKSTVADGVLNSEYVDGEPLSGILNRKVLSNDYDGALELVQEYCSELQKLATESFAVTEEFRTIFGDSEWDGTYKSCPVTDIDMIFSNIIVSENNWNVLDYEWTYRFPIPVKFVIFRAILAAGETVGAFLGNHLQQLGISEDEFQKFMEMESRFQLYVKGEEIQLHNFQNMQKKAGLASAAEVEALTLALQQKQEVEREMELLTSQLAQKQEELILALYQKQAAEQNTELVRKELTEQLMQRQEELISTLLQRQIVEEQNKVLQEQLKQAAEENSALLQQTQQAIESRAEMAEELQKISQCNKDLSAQMCRTSEKHRICSKKLEQAEIQISEAEERIKEISRQHESCQERLRASEIMVQKLGIKYSQLELVYNQIVMSRGWRFLNKYYAVRDAIFPKNSAIREFLKKIAQALFGKNAHSAQAQLPPAVQTSTPGAVPVRTIDGFDLIQHCKRIDILSVPHTAYIAKLLQSILLSAGLECQTHLSEPEQYEEIPYIMVCPQNFKRFPAVYIAFQMEQTINSRWLTEEYMDILHNAYAVFDYSLENIKYFNKDPLLASKMYYLPVDVCEDMMDDGYASEEKEYDVLFYGAPFVEHRQRYLKPIGEEFNLRIICEQFGPELYREMNKAKILINVHYYEDALLETTRLYETLSVSDCLIISERSGDPREEAALEGIVDFVEVGDVAAMMERIRYWLDHEEERKAAVVKNRATLEARANAAKFFLYRFLLANDRITFDNFYNSVGGYIHFNTDRICLSLPESTTRAAAFAEDNVYGFEFFPGLKHRMGWIGCGMSYKFMLRKAMEQKMEKILICEDDVYFPPDFQKRFDHVLKYAEENNDWNVFSGIMADIGRVKPLKYAQDEGEEFIYLDKMISMVFNLYDKSMFEAISAWDNMNRDVQKNTIDRYLEDKKLRILATCPFLVGHKEDLHSTIWGQQNTIYTELIANSSVKLQKLVEDFKKTL